MSHITIRRLSSGKFVTLQKCHTWVRIGPIVTPDPLRGKMTPPWEIAPWEIAPWELVWPPWENDLTPRWKMTRVIRINKGERNAVQVSD